MDRSSSALLNSRALCSRTASRWYRSVESNLLNAVVWTISAILVSWNVELNNSKSGVIISASVLNVLVMLFTTFLLGKGLKENRPTFIIPYIVSSLWSIYNVQWYDIKVLFARLIAARLRERMAWLSLGVYVFSLMLRIGLVMNIAKVALLQWYHIQICKYMRPSTPNIVVGTRN